MKRRTTPKSKMDNRSKSHIERIWNLKTEKPKPNWFLLSSLFFNRKPKSKIEMLREIENDIRRITVATCAFSGVHDQNCWVLDGDLQAEFRGRPG